MAAGCMSNVLMQADVGFYRGKREQAAGNISSTSHDTRRMCAEWLVRLAGLGAPGRLWQPEF